MNEKEIISYRGKYFCTTLKLTRQNDRCLLIELDTVDFLWVHN